MSVWMSHGDQISETPPGFRSLARSENSPIVVMGNGAGMLGLQFHPEVVHTPQGQNDHRELPIPNLRLRSSLDTRKLRQ